MAGTLILNAANTYTGSTTVNGVFTNTANPLNLTLQGGGSLAATSGITVNSGQLTLDDNISTNLGNRLGANSTVPVSLNGGVLQFNANNTAGTASVESTGVLSLAGGFDQIRVANAATTSTNTLTIANLTRSNNATVAFFGTVLGGGTSAVDNVKVTSALPLVGGIWRSSAPPRSRSCRGPSGNPAPRLGASLHQ